MRRFICVLLGLGFLALCGGRQPQVDRVIENGVEVVLNHHQPYKLKSEPSVLHLEEEQRINFGKEEFAELGLRYPEFADLDSEGNIYIGDSFRRGNRLIDKFDGTGRLIKSFGQRGQGPGELQYIYDLEIYEKDRILVSDPRNRKTVEFTQEGILVKESRYLPLEVIPLENGNFFSIQVSGDLSSGVYGYDFLLFDSKFASAKKLDYYDLLKSGWSAWRLRDQYYVRTANGKLIIWNEQNGYEIRIYDLEGKLLRKIRKDYKAVKYAEVFRKEIEGLPDRDYPVDKNMPPLNSFFVDDAGRIFVMTYERTEANEGFFHDIFSPEGVFIGRIGIPEYSLLGWGMNNLRATSKKGRFFRFWHREDGNIELIIYRMVWEYE